MRVDLEDIYNSYKSSRYLYPTGTIFKKSQPNFFDVPLSRKRRPDPPPPVTVDEKSVVCTETHSMDDIGQDYFPRDGRDNLQFKNNFPYTEFLIKIYYFYILNYFTSSKC